MSEERTSERTRPVAYYVIQNAENSDLYWCNQGWGEQRTAIAYSDDEIDPHRLPFDGKWKRVTFKTLKVKEPPLVKVKANKEPLVNGRKIIKPSGPRARFYVGVDTSDMTKPKSERWVVFSSILKPTAESHPQYSHVLGQFRTRKHAEHMAQDGE